MEKVITVQWLRAVAALSVVWFHSLCLLHYVGVNSFQGGVYALASIGAVGVDVFFVISGFIVTLAGLRAQSIRPFLTDRFFRIWPLYVVATVSYLAVRPDALSQPLDILLSLFFIQPLGSTDNSPTLPPGWTLLFEMPFYCVLAFAMAWRTPRALQERVAILLGVLVTVGSAYAWVRPLNVWGNPIALEFLLGVGIAHAWLKGVRLPRWLAIFLFSAGVYFLADSAISGNDDLWRSERVLDGSQSWIRFGEWGIPAGLIVASACLRSPPPEGSGRAFTYLGGAFYSIYLFHIHLMDWVSDHFNYFVEINPDLLVFGLVAGSVCLGITAHVALEKPLSKVIGRYRYRANSRSDSRITR